MIVQPIDHLENQDRPALEGAELWSGGFDEAELGERLLSRTAGVKEEAADAFLHGFVRRCCSTVPFDAVAGRFCPYRTKTMAVSASAWNRAMSTARPRPTASKTT